MPRTKSLTSRGVSRRSRMKTRPQPANRPRPRAASEKTPPSMLAGAGAMGRAAGDVVVVKGAGVDGGGVGVRGVSTPGGAS